MYEVFNYITGETIGYTLTETQAQVYCTFNTHCDYVNADSVEYDKSFI